MGNMKKKLSIIKAYFAFIFVSYCSYLIIATYVSGFGTNAPVMMEFYLITSAQQGFILTMQSVGALVPLVYLALHGERFNKINMFVVGMLLFGAACLAVGAAPPYAALIVLVMLSGAGVSVVDIVMNGMIPELFQKHKNTLIPLLHAFFGVGAMLAPITVTAIVNPDVTYTFARPFLLIGALGVFLSVIFFLVSRRVIPETPYADMASVRNRVSENPAEIFKTKYSWLFLIAGTLYFSFQVGLVNWLPTYCQEIGMDFDTSGAVLTAFFIGSLLMRFSGPVILKKISARTAYMLFSVIAALLITAALFMESDSAMIALIAIGGFMQGLCVALLVLMCTGAYPHRVASASSLPFIAANIAIMVAPLLMGALAEHIGFRIPLLIGCALLVVSAIPVFFSRTKTGKEGTP